MIEEGTAEGIFDRGTWFLESYVADAIRIESHADAYIADSIWLRTVSGTQQMHRLFLRRASYGY